DELPGSRTLAATLGVHRNTVLAAYRELVAEGWISTEEARGTFVSRAIPDVAPRRFSRQLATAIAPRAGFELGSDDPAARDLFERTRALPHTMMNLGGGIADVRLVPAVELGRAVRRVLRRRATDVLSYGDPEGPRPLRRALAEMVA